MPDPPQDFSDDGTDPAPTPILPLRLRDPKLLALIVEHAKQYLPRYQRELDGLRAAGFEVIGYVRKSPPKVGKSVDSRIQLIQPMAERLRDRSHVTHIYASASSSKRVY
ncbi:hypothetical protein BCR43DRAFT_504045 [Syncephalastrum racemosum]|uniref:Uncharacterized protein n=1 Tax=Syncephalastrum racemosum TaxID=13706 RepID=A0A1X2HJU3_SYNRA|nr:hypothetical protein BCR43DRAFT_504045 [Syncephalastrum racemosum]